MLRRTLISLFLLIFTTPLAFAHVHVVPANGSEPQKEYDYTKSDAKDCCNNGDCRPALKVKKDATHYHFWVEPKPSEQKHGYAARWVLIPVPEVKPNDLFGDRKAHWCGDLYKESYKTRCAFMPPMREVTEVDPFLDASLRRPGYPGASRFLLLLQVETDGVDDRRLLALRTSSLFARSQYYFSSRSRQTEFMQ